MAKSSIQLNVRNWIGDTRKLSLAARGLLIELLAHMYKEPDLEIPPSASIDGPLTTAELSLLTSAPESEVGKAMCELLASGLICITALNHVACRLNEKRKRPKVYVSPQQASMYDRVAVKIYEDWPRPGDRQESIKAVVRLLSSKVITPEELIARAERFRKRHETTGVEFIKKLVRWINQNLWEEEAEKDPETGSASDEFNKHWGRATK